MCVNCGSAAISKDNGKTWAPILPPKPRCSKCGEPEDGFHDEFIHMLVDSGRDLFGGMQERIFPARATPESHEPCGFRPQVTIDTRRY